MKVGIVEKEKNTRQSIFSLLEMGGFQPVLTDFSPNEKINFSIANTQEITKENQDQVINFVQRGGCLLLYGDPNPVIEHLFNLKITKTEEKKVHGEIEKEFIPHLEKTQYYDERKIPFSICHNAEWENTQSQGTIENQSILLTKNGIGYLTPSMFKASYSLLTDQENEFREGIFQRQFPVDSLLYVYSQILFSSIEKLTNSPIVTKWLWPNQKKSALCLTHDVDTAYDIEKGIETFRTLEKKFNVTSSWYFRPGDRYELTKEFIQQLIDENNEIGLHSINHAVEDPEEFDKQKKFVESYMDRKIVGVRSHALDRRPLLTQKIVQESDMIYDATLPDTDNCVPKHSLKGNTIFYPYTFSFSEKNNPLVLMSLTIHDWWYVSGNKWPDEQTMKFYIEKTDYLMKRNALNLYLVHAADYMSGTDRVWMYEKYLAYVTKIDSLWIAHPMEIAQWVQERNKLAFHYSVQDKELTITLESEKPTLPFSLKLQQPTNTISIIDKNGTKIDFTTEEKESYQLFHIH